MENILSKVYSKNRIFRYFWMIFGVLICAVSYNIFIYPYDIVFGGVGGISIIVSHFININPSLIMLFCSLIFCFIGVLFLDKTKVIHSVFGAIMFPIFVEITSFLPSLVKIDSSDMLLIALFGGTLYGLGLGLIMRSGFTLGGTDFLTQIVNKYFKITLGSSMLLIEGAIVVIGAVIFGFMNFMYAVLILYLITFLVDKVVLGISDKKAFYIVTKDKKSVCDYIIKELGHTVTIFSATGGFSKKKTSVLFTVVPTKEYYRLKEGIRCIDDGAFFTVVDAYEVTGGE